jgi:hypothetical protein
MKNIAEQLRQIRAVIEILKDARPLCEGPDTIGLVESALKGAETLQQLIVEGEWPGLPEEERSGDLGLPQLPVEALTGTDLAELCFPV